MCHENGSCLHIACLNLSCRYLGRNGVGKGRKGQGHELWESFTEGIGTRYHRLLGWK